VLGTSVLVVLMAFSEGEHISLWKAGGRIFLWF